MSPIVRARVLTAEPEVAVDALRAIYASLEIVEFDRARFSLRMDHVGEERFSLVRVALGASGRASADVHGDLVVGETRSMKMTAYSQRREMDLSRPFLHPESIAETQWDEGLNVDLVNLTHSAVDELVARHLGVDHFHVTFSETAPITPELGERWRATANYVRAAAGEAGLLENDLVRDAMFRTLASTVVAAFPNSSLDVPIDRAYAAAAPASLRRAVAYMEANVAKPIGVVEIAEAARLSPRGLQLVFMRTLGLTPMQYLRDLRLEGARAELLNADPGQGATVAVIAYRWGFVHAARFAARYRERYGENPAETLRN